jgi:cysteine desulfurase
MVIPRNMYSSDGRVGANRLDDIPLDDPDEFVYLDHAASSPIRPEALEVLSTAAGALYGNPSGAHAAGRKARRILDEARERAAAVLGVAPSQIVFTSGGTEADNMAVVGAAVKGRPVYVSAVEHHAVLDPAAHLQAELIPVHSDGRVNLDWLEDRLDPSAGLVSVMAANNETGAVQPSSEIAEIVRTQAPEAFLHVDAVAAYPSLDVTELARSWDLMSISAHKFGGPRGVGLLVVRRPLPNGPLMRGGGQEGGWRSGTENVAGIMAMVVAMEATAAARPIARPHQEARRARLLSGLSRLEVAVPTLPESTPVVPSIAHAVVSGVPRDVLVAMADRAGLCVSAGSACSSGAVQLSHVLTAMGLPRADAMGAVRFSQGWSTTDEEIDRAIEILATVFDQLRSSGLVSAKGLARVDGGP